LRYIGIFYDVLKWLTYITTDFWIMWTIFCI